MFTGTRPICLNIWCDGLSSCLAFIQRDDFLTSGIISLLALAYRTIKKVTL